jgi:hypothetical protein
MMMRDKDLRTVGFDRLVPPKTSVWVRPYDSTIGDGDPR